MKGAEGGVWVEVEEKVAEEEWEKEKKSGREGGVEEERRSTRSAGSVCGTEEGSGAWEEKMSSVSGGNALSYTYKRGSEQYEGKEDGHSETQPVKQTHFD